MLVDAIVTTKNGAYVRDLTPKDFRISEDNKDQIIRSFALESSADASQPGSLVLFFDQSSMEAKDQVAVLQSASRFIDAETGSNRKMAIVSYDGVLHFQQNFTDNPGRLKKALPGPASRAIGAQQTLGGTFQPTVESSGPIDDTGSRNMLQALRYLGTNLGVLPGRKIVVVFAGRVTSAQAQRSDLQEVIDACNKSGVAVYPVDVRPVAAPVTDRPLQVVEGRALAGIADPGAIREPMSRPTAALATSRYWLTSPDAPEVSSSRIPTTSSPVCSQSPANKTNTTL